MGCYDFFKFLLLMALLDLHKCTTAQDDFSGFHGYERDVLLSLKARLNNPFLDGNWSAGLMCYMNDPPYWFGIQCVNGQVTGVILESMGLTGEINTDALFNLTELLTLSFKNNFISGNMMEFTHNRKLRNIDLSRNNFHGSISPSLANLNSLESLQLQDNKLTGSIPKDEEHDSTILVRQREQQATPEGQKGKLIFIENNGETTFDLDDLLKASAEGLGKGNFGNCYKAMLDIGLAVVVKRLRDLKPLNGDEFMRQVRAIADQKHPNLLPLLAFYYSKDEKLFLYRFAPLGNQCLCNWLTKSLHRRKRNQRANPLPVELSARRCARRGASPKTPAPKH